MFCFADDMTMHMRNPKESTKESSASSSVTGCMTKTQTLITFLYTNIPHVQTKIFLSYNCFKENVIFRYMITKLLWNLHT